MSILELQPAEFRKIQKIMQDLAGINLTTGKQHLVLGRLSKRLRHYNLSNFDQYLNLVSAPENRQELQVLVNLLTTNETYFFREESHFTLLQTIATEHRSVSQPFNVWSAACSYGQEPYSIAMTLAETITHKKWKITASDISTQVLADAGKGLYPMVQSKNIDPILLKKYCLKGTGPEDGMFLIGKELRKKIDFIYINLNQNLPDMDVFDVIFLRNVMIYFDTPTKKQVIRKLIYHLKPGGFLLIGHSESLTGITSALECLRPSVYRKPR